MGIIAFNTIITVIIITICNIAAVVLLVVSLVMKHRSKKKGTSSKKYLIPLILCIMFLIPLISTVGSMIFSVIEVTSYHQSFVYSVRNGDYERAEKLLKKGAEVDCTAESDKKAKLGEQTLLSFLCENGGFTNDMNKPVDYEVTEDELAMIQLLIDYGADIESVTYIRSYDTLHFEKRCCYTPLMYAVDYCHPEIVQLLIENGADINAKNCKGLTPVEINRDNYNGEDKEKIHTLLTEATKNNDNP